jgi:hypothetical protein
MRDFFDEWGDGIKDCLALLLVIALIAAFCAGWFDSIAHPTNMIWR